MSISRKRKASQFLVSMQVPDVVRLWLFRIVAALGANSEIVSPRAIDIAFLTEALDMKEDPAWSEDEVKPRKVIAQLRHAHQLAEKAIGPSHVPQCLKNNVEKLRALLWLDDVDCRLLEFAVLIHTDRVLDTAADWLGALSTEKAVRYLAVILHISESEIRAALAPQGMLARSGLLSVDRNVSAALRSKLDLLSPRFADLVASTESDPATLLRDVVVPSLPPELAVSDYAHISKQLDIVRPYLRHVASSARVGVNILLYGAPGTGKTQLVRVLAAELGCDLFEVASEDTDGDAVSGNARLRAYRAAQCFLMRRSAMIIFDEVEDVFNDGDKMFGRRSTAQSNKAWINRTLESNAVPTFWLSNSVDCLDPAFIRRFDIVLDVPVPPKSHRARIISDACCGLLDQNAIQTLSESEHLAPAVVSRAAAVTHCIEKEVGPELAAAAFRQLLSNTLRAQGHGELRFNAAGQLPDIYDPTFINADADLQVVAQGLRSLKQARLCLFGPPGTGKTAFGHWLADQLGMPLHLKRASDILSMWVGGTEKNLAEAFRAAEDEKAVLLIDEVDSFLADRRGAQHSWEVTAVNEMLTQMEAFSGVFIASTNLMDGLDQASLRRFDLKVKFDYLRPEQAWRLLGRQCEAFGVVAPMERLRQVMNRLVTLTPGDFATVARQHRFNPMTQAPDVVRALELECSAKEKQGPIGFL